MCPAAFDQEDLIAAADVTGPSPIKPVLGEEAEKFLSLVLIAVFMRAPISCLRLLGTYSNWRAKSVCQNTWLMVSPVIEYNLGEFTLQTSLPVTK